MKESASAFTNNFLQATTEDYPFHCHIPKSFIEEKVLSSVDTTALPTQNSLMAVTPPRSPWFRSVKVDYLPHVRTRSVKLVNNIKDND